MRTSCPVCTGPAIQSTGKRRILICLFCGHREVRHENAHNDAMNMAPTGWTPIGA